MTTFTSPCHAGCILYNSTRSFNSLDLIQKEHDVSLGSCKSDCKKWQHQLWVGLYVFFVTPAVFFQLGTIPALLMRLTPVKLKSTQRALQVIVNQSIFIACTFLLGWLQDQSCIVWDSNKDVSGSCYIYNVEKYVKTITHTGQFKTFY